MQKCFESLNIIQHLSVVCAPEKKQNDFFMRISRKMVYASVEQSKVSTAGAFICTIYSFCRLFLFLPLSLCLFSLRLASCTYTHSLICSFAHAKNISICPLNATAAAAVDAAIPISMNSLFRAIVSSFCCWHHTCIHRKHHKILHRVRRKSGE